MGETLIEQLADFSSGVNIDELPEVVVEDCKRVLLDSIGCAIVGVEVPKGSIGVGVGRTMAGFDGEATMMGTAFRSSPYGAAFANAETINALDFDSVLPPGHVAPYVLPGMLGVAEAGGTPGRRVLEAIAVANEMSYRFGKSMDYHRTPKDGEMHLPSVLGFTSTVFGATAAISMVEGHDNGKTADALGIAGAISPVNSYRAWLQNLPNSSIKYTMPGPVTQAALTAAMSAGLGHTGDRRILDDTDFGYRRFIGTDRWEPDNLVNDLGKVWGFPSGHSYKPYPHCRVAHGPLDALIGLVEKQDIVPEEIEAIRCWGEAWIERPLWLNTDIHRPHEAQFSILHGLAVGAHRITPGPAWQQPETLRQPSVLDLMNKVTFHPHPDYIQTLSKDPHSRPTRVEVDARGTTYVAESQFPKGSPLHGTADYMRTDELIAKFRTNAEGRLSADAVDSVIDGVMHLEDLDSVRPLMRATSVTSSREQVGAPL